jgi:hypothetical protein|tara:strand:- start:367 stop:621 length:255 start_codon:yes stop_codon:yes gene_type:complete
MTERLELNFDDLTIGEIEEIEELTGRSIQSIQDPEAPMGSTLRVLAYIIKRRDNPEFTLEEAGDLIVIQGDDDDEGKGDESTDS